MKSPVAIQSKGRDMLAWQCSGCNHFAAFDKADAEDFQRRTGRPPVEAIRGPGLGVVCPCEEAEGVKVFYAEGARPGPGDRQLAVDVTEWRPA